MSGNGGGSFAAILLSIPLTAVALMSVFGIPQLSKVTSSLGSDPDSEVDADEFEPRSRSTKRRATRGDEVELEDAEEWGIDGEAEPTFGRSKSKLTRPRTILSETRSSRDSALGESTDGDLVTRGEAQDEFADEPASASRKAAANPFAPTRTESGSQRAGGRSDFAGAIQRLTSLGVDRFHLEPGLSSGQFLFVCIVDSAAASGAVHRFEAEAREPAAAVEDVIQQISEWKAESGVVQASAEEPVR